VWGTKNRSSIFNEKNRFEILDHIRNNCKEKNIHLDHINLHREHAHCLLALHADQTLKKTIQLIKGESSHWLNGTKLVKEKFEWADEYYGVSIGISQIDIVREYIRNQQKHHLYKSWKDECDEFLQAMKRANHG
jgi:REP element-mobilizing transposase RayT